MAVRVAAKPAASFPSSLSDAELEGAYRFFSNKKVTPAAIAKPHIEQTLSRIGDADVVLAIHDTTTLSFRDEGEREGFGSLTGGSQQLWTHATIAVSADGSREPLGLLAVRTEATIRYERWLDNVRDANALVGAGKLVHVQDREADDYRFYADFVGSGSRFVIRMQHDRKVIENDVVMPLTEALSHAALTVEREVMLGVRGKNKGSKIRKLHPARNQRSAMLSIAGGPITLRKPEKRNDELAETLDVHAVHVWEENPPEGEKAVKWLLVTSEPLETVEDMLRVVDWYRARWMVEEFFKALKTGCSIEKRQLESFHAFENVVAFF